MCTARIRNDSFATFFCDGKQKSSWFVMLSICLLYTLHQWFLINIPWEATVGKIEWSSIKLHQFKGFVILGKIILLYLRALFSCWCVIKCCIEFYNSKTSSWLFSKSQLYFFQRILEVITDAFAELLENDTCIIEKKKKNIEKYKKLRINTKFIWYNAEIL